MVMPRVFTSDSVAYLMPQEQPRLSRHEQRHYSLGNGKLLFPSEKVEKGTSLDERDLPVELFQSRVGIKDVCFNKLTLQGVFILEQIIAKVGEV